MRQGVEQRLHALRGGRDQAEQRAEQRAGSGPQQQAKRQMLKAESPLRQQVAAQQR